MEEYKKSFEESSFWTKNKEILLVLYEWKKELERKDLPEEQKELLQKFGCDIVQGYLVSKPCEPDNIEQLYLSIQS